MRYFSILLLVLLFSCRTDPRQWEHEYRRHIDTTAKNQLLLMRDSLDSICEAHYYNLLEHYIDSINKQRSEEIKKFLQDE